ncbi:MAG: AbrB/MazE/SpoVT family DNA-binding domain-containing protein [Actinobacteria bacterium]|nr:AbrB/MazE/SpoVT family DNA-binding domain-containing protein [Actinomycetota bacterium]
MRISTKGQVTVPLEIRRKLDLQPGTEVRFELDGASARLSRADGLTRGEALVAHLRSVGARARHTGMTTDEIMALTRGE